MAQEIERKFLVKGEFKPEVFKSTRITQGYLSSVPERTVRVRIKGEQGFHDQGKRESFRHQSLRMGKRNTFKRGGRVITTLRTRCYRQNPLSCKSRGTHLRSG